MTRSVSIVTVNFDSLFYIRLLVEKTREFVGARPYEIVVVDRGSKDGSQQWLRDQSDVHLIVKRQWRRDRHSHGEAAEVGVRAARNEVIVLLDSDAHPVEASWLEGTVDQLDAHCRLAGAQFQTVHRDNSYSWYIHPHFMVFFRQDLGSKITLRKARGRDTDTGEDSTVRILDAGLGVMAYPMKMVEKFSVGHSSLPTVAGGVFHAWYSTRLIKNDGEVRKETRSGITEENYAQPLRKLLRELYGLRY